jgi:hypothetical protein
MGKGLNKVDERCLVEAPRIKEQIKLISGHTWTEVEKLTNKWIKENNFNYIRHIAPLCGIGVIIVYEPPREKSEYKPPSCEICSATENDRHGRWIQDKFYCNECIIKKLNS